MARGKLDRLDEGGRVGIKFVGRIIIIWDKEQLQLALFHGQSMEYMIHL